METAQKVLNRLQQQQIQTREEIASLNAEIADKLLDGLDVVDSLQRLITLERLVNLIDVAMSKGQKYAAEEEQEAQRRQLADMEQEYRNLGNELEASKIGLQQYQTVLMPTPGGRLDTNLQPAQKAAMKVKQDAQQVLAGKLETTRRQIDHMKKVVNG